MPLIIPPGFAQGVMSYLTDGDAEPQVNTIGLDVTDAAGDFQGAVDKLHDRWGAAMLPNIATTTTLTHCTLYVGQDGGPPIVVDSTEAAVDGGAGSAALPPNCAYLLRKRTDLAGRRGRGRLYIPGVTETAVDGAGVITGSWVTDITTAGNAFLGDMADDTVLGMALPLVILHRSEGAGVEPAPTPIATFVCETKIATQRRRLRP